MTTKPPLAAVDPRLAHLYDENGVFYPETDGMPLPDGLDHERAFVRAVSTLEAYFGNLPDAAVSGNTFIYYRQGEPRRSVSPDCYVAFGVDMSHLMYRNTYRVWEMGKPPDFALEIASESTAGRDTGEKRRLYAEIGFGEYWRYDATDDSEFYGEPLVGERLAAGEYERLPINEEPDGLIWGHSPAIGLDLCWDGGRLRFRIPETGEYLLDYAESQAALLASETARTAAETARTAAEAEAAELREQLRRLRAEQEG